MDFTEPFAYGSPEARGNLSVIDSAGLTRSLERLASAPPTQLPAGNIARRPAYYPVQAFATARTIEGFIGIEVDMGMRTAIFGRSGDFTSAEKLRDNICELLHFLP